MKRNKLIVGIGLLLIGVFALYGLATAQMHFVTEWGIYGTGDGEFTYPRGIAVDLEGSIYVAESGIIGENNPRIQKYDGTAWQWTTLEIPVIGPHGVAVDSTGNVYVADTASSYILKFYYNVNGNKWQWEPLPPPSPDVFNQPRGIAVDSTGIVYVTDTDNHCVRKFDGVGWTTFYLTALSLNYKEPSGIAVDPAGNVYVSFCNFSTSKEYYILKLDSNFVTSTIWDTSDVPEAPLNDPRGIAVQSDPQGNVYICVADTYNHRILRFNSEGNYHDDWGIFGTEDSQFDLPFGIASDSAGNVYVADTYNHRIQKFTPCDPNNSAPMVGEITAPPDPVEVGNEIHVSASFTDLDFGDIHTATWDWGDENTSAGTVDQDNDNVTGGPYTYWDPGVYTLTLTVTDGCGEPGTAIFQYVVVYDPDGGFVTGGGWIDSPEGAYAEDPSLTGKANFGFISKYKNGATIPTGQTQFNFKAGDLNFHSDSYEWLVVAHHKAMYKGCGTINGEGNYGFMLSAIDAALTPSTDVDLFRIKLWDKDNGDALVYDNQMGADDDADPTTAIGGGSIVIHKAN